MHIEVIISTQKLILFDKRKTINYNISTAKKGVGQYIGSWKTPLGKHKIRAKIGKNAPINSVFIGRRLTGEIYSTELAKKNPNKKDWILTRILWLSGLEIGYNRLKYVDTMMRYIYIHGTPSHFQMGIPNSNGCIRMHNHAIVDLFDRVSIGTQIIIKENN